MTWYALLIAAVAVERVAELVVSQRNLSWSRARGGVEFGARHYPAMVVLHTGLLAGCLLESRLPPVPAGAGLADAGGRAGRAGTALVVHRDARPASGTPASSSSPMPRG